MFAKLIISLFILSHLLTSFYFQNNKSDKEKIKSKLGILSSPIYYLIVTLLLTITFISVKLLVVIFFISMARFLIYKFKRYVNREDDHVKTFLLFISEQFLHVVVILAFYPLFKTINPNRFIDLLIEKLQFIYPFLEYINDINLLTYLVLITAGILFTINGGTILSLMIINLPLEKVKLHKKDTGFRTGLFNQEIAATSETMNITGSILEVNMNVVEEEKKRYGKIIGIIERLIIVTAMLINKFELIAIVTAIKSIARFKELTTKTSDYYIVGTFASFSIAFLIGLLLLFFKKVLLG